MTTTMILRGFGRCERSYSKCAGIVKPAQGQTGGNGVTKMSPDTLRKYLERTFSHVEWRKVSPPKVQDKLLF